MITFISKPREINKALSVNKSIASKRKKIRESKTWVQAQNKREKKNKTFIIPVFEIQKRHTEKKVINLPLSGLLNFQLMEKETQNQKVSRVVAWIHLYNHVFFLFFPFFLCFFLFFFSEWASNHYPSNMNKVTVNRLAPQCFEFWTHYMWCGRRYQEINYVILCCFLKMITWLLM